MKLNLYSIKDTKVEYMSPFLMHNHAEAKRALATLARDNQTEIGKNPADYELWYVGEWDSQQGLIMSTGPEYIMTATEAGHGG